MTDKNDAPFDNAVTPKNPGVVAGKNRPVGSSRAAHLARMALKKAASKPVKEEVELDEAFINGREYASHGLMHPTHAAQPIHRVADHYVDFYASGTGDKMQGKVKVNDGKSVHIQAHPKSGDGKLHKFKVSSNLPKMDEEVEQVEEGLVGDLARAYFAPKAKAAASKLTTKVAKKFGATPQTQRRLAGAAAKWAVKKLGEGKDDGEYDYEGDMAMSQLKSIIANAQKLHDMLEPNTNLPEWVQSKITLAEDYVVTAANYMNGELDEEVEQIEEKKMGYANLASTIKSKLARKKIAEAHDPVGKEDADINNDGTVDKTDVYLHTKRRAIGKAIANRQAKAGK